MTDYYERSVATHVDGSPVFKTEADERSEHEIATLLGRAWHVELHSFGRLAPVDWYATRQERVVGVLELKTRGHAMARYPTVFLNVRKWLALNLCAVGLGVPAIFVVRFIDGVRWVPVSEIDASSHTIGGCLRLVKARNDVEPVIGVPIELMREIRA